MRISSRITLAVAALTLGLLYVFPLWSITLEAPQYPEGIGIYIWIDTVTGHKPNDLQNINGLNHYIGMKRIEPETIPELTLMPWIIGLLMVMGLGAAASGKRWLLYAWVGAFLVVAVAGLVDFYLWEYDYGHNLDPTAAIKVPGMSYQPPLIGAKKLLNFNALSWPAWGGWAAFLSLGTGLLLALIEFRRTRRMRLPLPEEEKQKHTSSGTLKRFAAVVPLALLLAACTPEPKPLHHGRDTCTYCKMMLSDERYGAELVTTKGKVYTFDSIECLAAHRLEGLVPDDEVHSLWVVDFQAPPALVRVDDAFFMHSRDLRSPMGLNLTAFGPGIRQQAVSHAFYGDILDWNGVLDLIRNDAPHPSDADAAAHRSNRPQP